ncbi:MAG: O-antigen ligase family protein [Candidatus Parcubacteria bacterium]|nr:O-antigen ligase family protein [Candidatus Parcubacteria bacterium]
MLKLAKTIEYLFYLFIFLLPWQTRWIWHYGSLNGGQSEYLTFSLYGTEILLWLILLLAIIYKIKVKDEDAGILNYKILDFYMLFGLLVAVSLVSLIWAADKQVALYYIVKLLNGLALLIFIINFKFSYKKVGLAIVTSGFAQGILAISQFLTQKVWASKWLGMAEQLPQTLGVSVVELVGMRWLRAYGSLAHPNMLGGFLVISCLCLVVLLILTRKKWEKVLLWIFWPVILVGLFFTFSRSAFLALGIGFLFLSIFIFLSYENKAKIILSQLIGSGFLVLAVLTLLYSPLVFTRINGEERLEQKSTTDRVLYFEQAKDLIQTNWLNGVGLGNYTLALFDNLPEKQWAGFYQPVHNVYVLVAVELGILGFLIFILIIINALRKIWEFKIDYNLKLLAIFKNFEFKEIYHFYKNHFFWLLGLTGILIAILILMAFDHYFWTMWFGIALWWLCLGLWLKQVGLVK